jgi:predicted DNA-binding transcriptional regulator AlpA
MTNQPAQPVFLGTRELRERLGKVSDGRLTRLTHRDDFPVPVARLQQGRIWLTEEVDKWIAEARTVN